jgi:acetolactate synthase-1/2/3 large subunit
MNTPSAETCLSYPLPAESITGAQGVAEVIAAQERPVVYGMPGGYTTHIYDALFSLQGRVETYLVRQESVATVMAEAQGRLTGRPAFVIGQGAWVLGNAGIGIMEAHLGASPVVLLIDATDGGAYSHHGPYQAGGGGYGAYDLPAAMSAITKRTFVATEPVQAIQMTQLAIKHATTGEPGPVAVIFNGRSLFNRIGQAAGPRAYLDRSYASPSAPAATPASVTAAADFIRAASCPVIVSGNGVRLSKAETSLLDFAHGFSVPVATTPAGKGTFPEEHDLALGVIGAFGHATANSVVGAADLVIAVGSKLGSTDTANSHPDLINVEHQLLVQLDIEPLNMSWTFPASAMVQGDAGASLGRIAAELKGYSGDGISRVADARAEAPFYNRAVVSAPGSLSARDVVAALSDGLPNDAIVTCDAGENRLFVLRDFRSKLGGTVLQPSGGGGMAYALPAGMAAAVSFPGRSVVAVCGDGGFAMSLHSLISAVELGLHLTVLVLNNKILGWVYNGQRGRNIASEFADFDYAKIAQAIGCNASTVDTLGGFRAALTQAQRNHGVSVIVAMTTKADRYQDIMSPLNSDDVYAVPRDY